MKAKTRLFGEIEIADDKIITLEKGMIGFPDLNHFALIFDKEKGPRRITIRA
jgi:flagellar assembly factor FliW